MLFEQNIASNVTRNEHAQARPSAPKRAQARPSLPKRAQARPSAPKHAQALWTTIGNIWKPFKP